MKTFLCFILGIACGFLLAELLATEGRSAELKSQQVYFSQVQSDLANEKQTTIDDVRANMQTTLADLHYGGTLSAHGATANTSGVQKDNANLAHLFSSLSSLATISSKPEWQIHIDWAAHNYDAGGATNCPLDYLSAGQGACVITGGRACVIGAAATKANDLYKGGNVGENLDKIKDLVLLTQCHNDEARAVLAGVNNVNVANYLKAMGKQP